MNPGSPLDEEPGLDIPPAWRKLPLESLRGTMLVVGGPNVGKSTFSRYLFRRLNAAGLPTAYLDGDPGQSSLGPPSTLTLGLPGTPPAEYSPQGRLLRRFIGSTTPRGHMLPVVVGAARLAKAAFERGAVALVYDTSGLVDPSQGGLALKQAKIDLLEPAAIFAIQSETELEPLLRPLRRSRRFQIFQLSPSIAARSRDTAARQEYRAGAFSRYFQKSRSLKFEWPRFAILPSPRFLPDRLVGLDNPQGFTLGLGIVRTIDRVTRQVDLITPLDSMEGVDTILLGDLLLDPATFRDRIL